MKRFSSFIILAVILVTLIFSTCLFAQQLQPSRLEYINIDLEVKRYEYVLFVDSQQIEKDIPIKLTNKQRADRSTSTFMNVIQSAKFTLTKPQILSRTLDGNNNNDNQIFHSTTTTTTTEQNKKENTFSFKLHTYKSPYVSRGYIIQRLPKDLIASFTDNFNGINNNNQYEINNNGENKIFNNNFELSTRFRFINNKQLELNHNNEYSTRIVFLTSSEATCYINNNANVAKKCLQTLLSENSVCLKHTPMSDVEDGRTQLITSHKNCPATPKQINNDDNNNNEDINNNHNNAQFDIQQESGWVPNRTTHPLKVSTTHSRLLQGNDTFYTSLNFTMAAFNEFPALYPSFAWKTQYPGLYNHTMDIFNMSMNLTIVFSDINSANPSLNEQLYTKSKSTYNKLHQKEKEDGVLDASTQKQQMLTMLTLHSFNTYMYDSSLTEDDPTNPDAPKNHYILPLQYDKSALSPTFWQPEYEDIPVGDTITPYAVYDKSALPSTTRKQHDNAFYTQTITLPSGLNSMFYDSAEFEHDTNRNMYRTGIYGPSRILTIALPMDPFGYTNKENHDPTNILHYTVYITLFNDTFVYPTIEHQDTITWAQHYQPRVNYDLKMNLPKGYKNDFDFGTLSSLRMNLPNRETVNYDTWEIDFFTNEMWLDPLRRPDCKAYWTDEECTETRECDSDGCTTKVTCWDVIRSRPDITMLFNTMHQFHLSYSIKRTGLVGYRKPYFACQYFRIYNSFLNEKLYKHYTRARVYDLRHYFINRAPSDNVLMDWQHSERPVLYWYDSRVVTTTKTTATMELNNLNDDQNNNNLNSVDNTQEILSYLNNNKDNNKDIDTGYNTSPSTHHYTSNTLQNDKTIYDSRRVSLKSLELEKAYNFKQTKSSKFLYSGRVVSYTEFGRNYGPKPPTKTFPGWAIAIIVIVGVVVLVWFFAICCRGRFHRKNSDRGWHGQGCKTCCAWYLCCRIRLFSRVCCKCCRTPDCYQHACLQCDALCDDGTWKHIAHLQDFEKHQLYVYEYNQKHGTNHRPPHPAQLAAATSTATSMTSNDDTPVVELPVYNYVPKENDNLSTTTTKQKTKQIDEAPPPAYTYKPEQTGPVYEFSPNTAPPPAYNAPAADSPYSPYVPPQ